MPPEVLEHETRKVLAMINAMRRGMKKSMPQNLARIGHRISLRWPFDRTATLAGRHGEHVQRQEGEEGGLDWNPCLHRPSLVEIFVSNLEDMMASNATS